MHICRPTIDQILKWKRGVGELPQGQFGACNEMHNAGFILRVTLDFNEREMDELVKDSSV